MISIRRQRPSRWIWLAPVLAVALIASCESGLSPNANNTWGLVTVDASKNASGDFVTSPVGRFFVGQLSTVPNAKLVLDSCADALYSAPTNDFTGVTFLDAGLPVTTMIGTRLDTLQRDVNSQGQIIYERSAGGEIPYTPGDSIVVSVPGAVGGFPATSIRAKTAEAFTMDPVSVPTGSETIQLHWTAAHDANSALILELRYDPSGGGVPTRELLCSYHDNGVDSIPSYQYQPWAASTASAREVVATRLRTNYLGAANNGLVGVISLFQVPTPPVP